MVLRHPITAIAVCGPYVAVAWDNHVQLIGNASTAPELQASTTATNAHTMRISIIIMNETHVVSVGEDKVVKVWTLPRLSLESSRSIHKRANILRFDGSDLVIGDKSGDVFVFPLNVDQDNPEYIKDCKLRLPILGHVSMLTDLTLWPSGSAIVTCDRDEHIRISKWPQAYDIKQFLFGHDRAVASLLLLNENTLLSAGGDADLFLWDLFTESLIKTIPISIVSSFSIIESPKQQHKREKAKQFAKKKKSKRKGQIGIQPVEEARAEADEGSHHSDRSILIKKMLALDSEHILIMSSGATALFLVNVQTDQVTPVNLKYPALDICATWKELILVSLDISKAAGQDQSVIILEWRSDKTLKQVDHPVSKLISEQCSIEVTKDKPFPNVSTLYWELDLLFKDASEHDFVNEKMEQLPHFVQEGDEDSPVDTRPAKKLRLDEQVQEME